MRRKRRFQGPPPPLGFNFTPLIDVMFLLTIFFMLVAKFTSAEHAVIRLPHPENSRAQALRMPDRIVVNCRLVESDGGLQTVEYSIGPNQPEPLSVISERLAAYKRQSPDVKVVIRADRRLHYSEVRELMRVVGENHIERLNVAAIASETD